MDLAGLFTKLAVIGGSLGLAFANIREGNQVEAKLQSEQEHADLVVTRQIPIEIVEGNTVTQKSLYIEENIPQTDHLEETNYIAQQMLECFESRTESPNASVFYSAQATYLRNQQLEIMKNPASIKDVKANVQKAQDWYKQSKGLAANDFKIAFQSSSLEVASGPAKQR